MRLAALALIVLACSVVAGVGITAYLDAHDNRATCPGSNMVVMEDDVSLALIADEESGRWVVVCTLDFAH